MAGRACRIGPIERMRWVELAAGFTSLAVFLVWQWQALVNLVARAIPAGVAAALRGSQAVGPMSCSLRAATASVGAVVLAALHRAPWQGRQLGARDWGLDREGGAGDRGLGLGREMWASECGEPITGAATSVSSLDEQRACRPVPVVPSPQPQPLK
jgi:hypothetical protein